MDHPYSLPSGYVYGSCIITCGPTRSFPKIFLLSNQGQCPFPAFCPLGVTLQLLRVLMSMLLEETHALRTTTHLYPQCQWLIVCEVSVGALVGVGASLVPPATARTNREAWMTVVIGHAATIYRIRAYLMVSLLDQPSPVAARAFRRAHEEELDRRSFQRVLSQVKTHHQVTA